MSPTEQNIDFEYIFFAGGLVCAFLYFGIKISLVTYIIIFEKYVDGRFLEANPAFYINYKYLSIPNKEKIGIRIVDGGAYLFLFFGFLFFALLLYVNN